MNGALLWIFVILLAVGAGFLVVRYGFGSRARSAGRHDYTYGDSGSSGASGGDAGF